MFWNFLYPTVTQVENALCTARTTQADSLVPLGGGLFRVWHHIPHLRVFSDVLCSWQANNAPFTIVTIHAVQSCQCCANVQLSSRQQWLC